MKCQRSPHGLTLVEVMVAVAISGISTAALFSPFTASILLLKQEKPLTEARDLARLEIENIRKQWSATAGYGSGNATVPIDATAWPGATTYGTATPVTSLSMGSPGGTWNKSIATLAPNAIPSAPGDVTGYTGYKGATVAIPKGIKFSANYIAQIIVGRPPGFTGDQARRVVVRLFAASASGNFATGVSSTQTQVKSLIASDGAVISTNLRSGLLTVLVTDVAAP